MEPVGHWDRSCGFETRAEAALERRREDQQACRFSARIRNGYPTRTPRIDPKFVRADLEICSDSRLSHGLVLTPIWPLTHPDHLLAAQLVIETVRPRSRIVGYVEQPYASLQLLARIRGRSTQPPPPLVGPGIPIRTSPGDWLKKGVALSQYRSQLKSLRPLPRARILSYEALKRGETLRRID